MKYLAEAQQGILRIMDNRNMSLWSESIDWNDPAFANSEFQDSTFESPYGASALNDFTNLAEYSDSPGWGLRTPSKSGPDAGGATGTFQPAQVMAGAPSKSAESSSQDSSSDSSSRRKRKTTSESPMSDTLMMKGVAVKEESPMNMGGYQNMQAFEQSFNQPLPNLAVDQAMSDNDAMFDFNSAASSPNLPRDFNQQLSLDAKLNPLSANVAPAYMQESPVRAINPGVFMNSGSRGQSPANANLMFNAASPNAMFSTPSSDSNDAFAAAQNWNPTASQNPAWPTDFTSQFASPGGLAFTPSPAANGATPALSARGVVARGGRSPLHIAPISAKSRVETQINIIMTLERPPPGIEHLHLPLHTIAKSKLLAKEDYDKSKVLELHTMLVCSSAMHNAAFKEKALKRAAAQSNTDIQKRAEQQRDSGDDEKNDMKNVDDADKPANGGEVRICSNCIQRERKRAGRKKLKKEEEQQHWERYETERVVVFNSNEYLPFKSFDPSQQPQRDSSLTDEPYSAPDGAISVSAAMRIACYCRHQSEKEGFQVIFTLKDQRGNVVAQEMSDSILITDDHKTHPPQLTTMTSDVMFHPAHLGANGGLPTSYSMMDLPSHAQPFQSSRSAGNLQALAYSQQPQFNPHSHVHQLSHNGYASQATSATMTPTNLSRPGSPTSAGQSGPNKKRKSSTFHKRLPSGLQMTPRVDATQSQPASAIPGVSMGSSFSPTGFGQQNDQSFMTVPNSATQAQFFGSGPPTPANDQGQFAFGHPHQLDITRAQNASAYFSHPSSAVPSRSNSPVLPHSRLNIAAFQRQPVQTTTNQVNRNSQIYGGQANMGAMQEDDEPPASTMTKITPASGPVSGGTEVSIFGYNFTHHTQIMFGDSLAPTTFYGSQCILATSPPGRRGQVPVKIVSDGSAMQFISSQSSQQIFNYTDTNPQMMEMALRLLSQQQTGDSGQWMQFTNQVANQFMQTSISPAGIQNQGYGGGAMLAMDGQQMEDVVLKVFELVDLSDSPREPCYDMRSESGETMLILAAALGMHRVAAALLARGVNTDLRDKGGYTALMHAALHSRTKTFQLLLVKGADSTVRSLKGYAAIDLVPISERDAYAQILQNTRRSRNVRPSFHVRNSYGSYASSKQSWDISSASFYESEADSSEHTISTPPSRRASENPIPPEIILHTPIDSQPLPSAAMIAWREALAAQIHHFQRTFHDNMSSFQLPALPPIPDYQDNAMVRRLSSLVPSRYTMRMVPHVATEPPDTSPIPPSRFWDMFTSAAPSPSATPPPPSYSELFPDQVQRRAEEKKSSIEVVVVEAVADEKCSLAYDQSQVQDEPLDCSAPATQIPDHPKKTDHRSRIFLWLWVSKNRNVKSCGRMWLTNSQIPLLMVMTSLLVQVFMPHLSFQALQAFSSKPENLRCCGDRAIMYGHDRTALLGAQV